MFAIPVRKILAALLLSSTALAQSVVLSPQAIVVNPLPSFDVAVWLDRAPDGRGVPSYAVGEPIRVGVRTGEDSYVYLFSVSATNEVVQILPNRFDDGRDAFLSAGATRYFPPDDARYTFTADAPGGLAKVIAVASRRPLDTRTLASFGSEHDFMATSRLGEEGFAQALSIVVRPLPQASWVTATAQFHVGALPSVEPINNYLGLMPYPGSVVTRQSGGRRDSETTFTSDARLRDIYEHFHQQLVRDGWRRTDHERDDDEVEAEYRRDGVSFELKLEATRRGRFVLEIDFD